MSAQTNRFARAAKIAKRLYKTGRYKTYADAVKAAFKKLPGKSKAARKVGKVRHGRKHHAVKRKKRIVIVTGPVSSISGAKQTMKNYYADKLKNALYKRDQSATKRGKKIWGKLITEYRKQLKKYSS